MEQAPNKNILRHSLIAVGIISATVLLEELLRIFGIRNVELVLLFMLSTFLIACFTTSYFINISAAVVNTVLYDYLVTEPRMDFSFKLGLPITLMIMLIVSIITSATTTKINEQMIQARQQEQRTELMLQINRKLSAAGSVNDIVAITTEYLALYGMRGIFYLGAPANRLFTGFSPAEQDDPPAVNDEDIHAADMLYHSLQASGCDAPVASSWYYIPVHSGGKLLGMVALNTLGTTPDKNQAAFAHLLAGHTALAIELRYAQEERTRTMMMAEKEKTRSNLLRAVSHDLRTPLTGIYSASSILAKKTGDPMAVDICNDSMWLINMVENLLMVTRIYENDNTIVKKDELAEEIMARATGIVRKRFPHCRIQVSAPNELAIVPMDAMLISQVFINLLENAAKYSGDGGDILFNMVVQGGSACFTISDSGNGIPDDLLDNLFGQHVASGKRAVDSISGMGLGLSICKTIVEAHSGTIMGKNKPEGGAQFTVTLPMNS